MTLWFTASDSLSWSQGHSGKGFILHDGAIKTWNVDPFHPTDQRDIWERNRELSPIALNFDIDPDGGVVTAQPSLKVESIVQADPRLYDAGQRPVFEDNWDLQDFEPKPETAASPDYNFIMSAWEGLESHRNHWTGQLCHCGWGSRRVKAKLGRLAGLQMRRLLKAPDKAYRTPEGQQLLQHLQTLPEEYDSLYPYLAHRFKKGDIRLNMEPADARPQWQQDRDRERGTEYEKPDPRLEWQQRLGDYPPQWWTVREHLPQWHQWFEARQHPTRRGVNVMDANFTPSALEAASLHHQKALEEARAKQNWLNHYGQYAPNPAHVFGPEAGKYKGWQVIPLDEDQAEGDSEALGHCIGSDEQPYKYNIGQGNIDAYSLRDKEGYPHVSWHFNPGGADIGHMQGQGTVNDDYRNLMTMFHEAHGLSDTEGYEEQLEDPDREDAVYTFPVARDVQDYNTYFGEDYPEYADNDHNANIGEFTEFEWEDPDWTAIARDFLNYPSQDHEKFMDIITNRRPEDLPDMAGALEENYNPDNETHRDAGRIWNEGAPARYELDVPPPVPDQVDDYNEHIENGYDPEPTDWDSMAQDYLGYPHHYGKSDQGPTPYHTFHTHINARDHQPQMYDALQQNIDWDNAEHQEAAQYWNQAYPRNNLYPPGQEPPQPLPGQMGWDWPDFWTRGDQDTSNYNWDKSQYVVPSNEHYYPRAGSWTAQTDELHVALAIPSQITEEIHAWVKDQDWPEGTELEDPDDYHITLLYAPDGHEDHHDADWIEQAKGFEVEVSRVEAFTGGDGDPAIVLRIQSPAVKALADDLQGEAEEHDLEISKFPGGYKPHITVAYGPGKPKRCRAPKLKFRTGPSSVSEPRESAWHFGDGPYGYTNGDTSEVGLIMDNDSRLSEMSRKLVEQGGTPQELREWAIKRIIGPHNREQIKDAKEWNAIPLEERQRMKRQHDIDQFGEEAVNIGEGLMQPFNDWENEGKDEDEIRREQEYEAPDLIDPELVNWDELHQGILDEFDENAEYERQQQRNRDSGLGWANNGGDDRDKMRDAFYRYHGALPEEEIQAELGPGYHSSDPRHEHNRSVNIPFEQMEQLSNWPEHYSLGRDPIWKHRFERATQKAREELLARGIAPDKVEEVLDDRRPFAPDYIKEHFPGGKYDTPINMEDPEERAAFLSDPGVQDIQQNGYNMRLHDLYSDLSHAISYGQPHPHTPQMAEALQQRGYTPEQIQSIMAQQWQWDEIARQRVPVNAPPPMDQWAQQAEEQRQLDQPGDLTIPQEWTAAKKYADADHMLAPAVELQEWLADLGGEDATPPSIHHDDESDLVMSPTVSQRDSLPYFPPAHVPKEYKQGSQEPTPTPGDLWCPGCGTTPEYQPMAGGVSAWYRCPNCEKDALASEGEFRFSGLPEVDHQIYRGLQATWRPRHEVQRDTQAADEFLGMLQGDDQEHLGRQAEVQTRPDHQLWFTPRPDDPSYTRAGRGFVHVPTQTVHTWPEREATHAQMAQGKDLDARECVGFFTNGAGNIKEIYGPQQYRELITQADPRLSVIHPRPDDPSGDWETDGGHRIATMTLPQELRVWQEVGLEGSPEDQVGQLENGYTVRRHPYPETMNAVGDFMRNCWQEKNQARMDDEAQKGFIPHSLHDEHGLPRAAFYVVNSPNIAGGHSNLTEILGMRNQELKPEYAAPLADWAESQGHLVNGRTPEDYLDYWQDYWNRYGDQLRQMQAHNAAARTADSPITQADATNDPLGKPPAIIPSPQGDPDYLEVTICPNCQQPHRPDEPCPESSVAQYRRMQRQWGARDPNSFHGPQGAPDGLQDHPIELGKIAAGGNWDPTICEACGHRMGEPKSVNGRWLNTCTYCGRTRTVPNQSPLLQQQLQNWPPYPDLLREVEQKPRAWVANLEHGGWQTEAGSPSWDGL